MVSCNIDLCSYWMDPRVGLDAIPNKRIPVPARNRTPNIQSGVISLVKLSAFAKLKI